MLRQIISTRVRRRPSATNRTLSSGGISVDDPLQKLLRIDPVVQRALDENRPVVALESTIVAHGMPFPENLLLAQQVEGILQSKVRLRTQYNYTSLSLVLESLILRTTISFILILSVGCHTRHYCHSRRNLSSRSQFGRAPRFSQGWRRRASQEMFDPRSCHAYSNW